MNASGLYQSLVPTGRYFFLFILSSFVCAPIHSQTVKPEWGDQSIKTRHTPTLERIVKGQPDELIAVGIRKTHNALNLPDTYVAIRFDKGMKQVMERELFSTRYRDDFQHVHNFKGNVFLFTRQFNREEKMSTLYSIQIDPVTLQVIDSNAIGQYKAKNRRWQPGTKIKVSPDTSHILVFAEAPYRFQAESELFYVSVWDHHMNKLWEKAITLPYSNKYFVLEGFDISNEGEVYIMGKHYDRGVMRERVRENGVLVPSYTYKILFVGKNDDQPKEHVVSVQDKFVHSMALQFDTDGNINLPGLYKNKSNGHVTGHFIGVLDKNSPQTTIQKLDTFPVNDLLELLRKDWCASTNPKDPGLSDRFKVMGTNKRSDGSIDLLTEYNYSYEDRDSNSSKTIYVANDILVINYKKDGRPVYTRIPKWQRDDNDNDYISFKWMKHGSALRLFYLDSEKNVKKELSKRPHGMSHWRRTVFVVASINDKGELQREVAYSHKDIDIITAFRLCTAVDTDMLALFAIKGRLFSKTKFQFGRLKL